MKKQLIHWKGIMEDLTLDKTYILSDNSHDATFRDDSGDIRDAYLGDWLDLPSPLTGGSNKYYVLKINNPEPYVTECMHIIDALNLNFAEGNIFKAIWRKAAQRLGNEKPGSKALYEAQKIKFFADRLLERTEHESEQTN